MRRHRQSALVVGLTLLLPLALFFYACGVLWVQRAGYQQDIERLLPRIARLNGLIASEQALRESAGQVDSRVLDLDQPQTEPRAATAAARQQDVRKMLIAAGLEVRNSQLLPARELDGLDYLSVKLRVSGELAALDRALQEIVRHRPLMLVESIDVTPVRSSRRRSKPAQQAVTVNLQLLALRAGAVSAV